MYNLNVKSVYYEIFHYANCLIYLIFYVFEIVYENVSYGGFCDVIGWAVPGVSKGCAAFIFKVKQSKRNCIFAQLDPWRWRHYNSPGRLEHSVTSQKSQVLDTYYITIHFHCLDDFKYL